MPTLEHSVVLYIPANNPAQILYSMACFFTHTSTESRLMSCDVRNEVTMNTRSINFEPVIDNISSCLLRVRHRLKVAPMKLGLPMSKGRRHRISLSRIPGQSLSVTLHNYEHAQTSNYRIPLTLCRYRELTQCPPTLLQCWGSPGYLMCLLRQQLYRIGFRYQPVNLDAYHCQGSSNPLKNKA